MHIYQKNDGDLATRSHISKLRRTVRVVHVASRAEGRLSLPLPARSRVANLKRRMTRRPRETRPKRAIGGTCTYPHDTSRHIEYDA